MYKQTVVPHDFILAKSTKLNVSTNRINYKLTQMLKEFFCKKEARNMVDLYALWNTAKTVPAIRTINDSR